MSYTSWYWFYIGLLGKLTTRISQRKRIPEKYRKSFRSFGIRFKSFSHHFQLFRWTQVRRMWLVGLLVDYWFTDWLIDLLVYSLIDWLIDVKIDWLIDWLLHWLIDWLIYRLTDRVIVWLYDWLTDWFTDWFTD